MNDERIDGGIEYVGKFGITRTCIDGLLRYLQFDEPIKEAKLISHDRRHGFILYTDERRDTIVVRAGFGSGYPGEGSGGLAYVLSILKEFNIDVEEYDVSGSFFKRLNRSQLNNRDLENLDSMRPVTHPTRIYDYIYEYRRERKSSERNMPIPIPLSLIDDRIRDLAIGFWTAPGDRILTGFKRLEDALRTRCQSEEHGAKLFQAAFMGDKSSLEWEDINNKEQAARTDLFKAVYGSFRNPRAHKELDSDPEELLSEFLTLNQLFRLENQAVMREP